MTQGKSFKRTAVAVGLTFLLLPLGSPAAPEKGTRFFVRDHLGSVVAVTDGAGNILARNRFKPYGDATALGSGTNTDDYARFTGKEKDSATGLYYFEARYYDPALGRFLSPDPAKQIRSPYAYAGSWPLANVDSDGREFAREELNVLWGLLERKKRGFGPVGTDRAHRVPTVIDLLKMRAYRIDKTANERLSRFNYVKDMLKMRPSDFHDDLVQSKRERRIDAAIPVFNSLRKDLHEFRHALIDDLGLKEILSKLAELEDNLQAVRKEIRPKHINDSLTEEYNNILTEMNKIRGDRQLMPKLRILDIFDATVKELEDLEYVYIDGYSSRYVRSRHGPHSHGRLPNEL